ncbi:MAG: DNA translocase FtsK 4TM domain-containing protein [Chloroflexi bacterium]|nr:DNA translocase FtsK 4TM domain-containing protein [Chloroflexota bacterium]
MATRKQEPTPKQTSNTKSPAKAPDRSGTGRGRTVPTVSPKRAPAKTEKPKRPRPRTNLALRLNLHQKVIIGGLFLFLLTGLFGLSLFSPEQGELTASLARYMWQGFGWGSFLVIVVLVFTSFYLILWGMEQPPPLPVYRLAGLGGLFLCFEAFATFIAFAQLSTPDVWAVANEGLGGGYLGAVLVATIENVIGTGAAIMLYLVIGALSTFLLTGLTRTDIVNTWESLRRQPTEPPLATGPVRPRPPMARPTPPPPGQPVQPPLSFDKTPTSAVTPPPPSSAPAPTTGTKATPPERPHRPGASANRQVTPPAKPTNVDEAPAPQPIFVGQAPAQNWKLPILAEMLEIGTDQNVNNDHIREQIVTIEKTLESFGAPVRHVETNAGPTVIQYGVEPLFVEQRSGKRTKVKVGKIASLADDLSLALSAKSIRVQAPVPGKGYVGIEVPNTAKAIVSLRDVMESASFTKIKSPLAIGLGQDVAGQAVSADLTKMPHLLIAGATGSGKSVCVNGIIACLLLQNTPDDLKLVMVDPKRVELTGYNGIPHLAAPVVVDLERVVGTLQWALREMDKRYKAFSATGVRNIQEFNKKLLKEKGEKLPYIVIIIDELADLMMLAPEETERGITRLAQMARATGIHMILATQRPSVDVVTGLIKANFPARIAFAVASSIDSRVILDSVGAERLLGQGDMLFQSPDAAAPLRLQGCYVGDAELDKLIAYWQRARRTNLITPETHAVTVGSEQSTVNSKQSPVSSDQSSIAASPPRSLAASPRPPVAPSPTPVPPPVINTDPKAVPPAATFSTNRPVDPEPRWLPAKPSGQPPASQPPAGQPVSRSAGQPSAVSRSAGQAVSRQPVSRQAEVKPAQSSALTPQSAPAHPQANQPLWEELIAQEAAAKVEDDLLPEAIAMVRELKKASTSLLQRRFRIGYTRAARLIDLMEEQGIIGPPTGTSKAREIVGNGSEEGSASSTSSPRTKMGSDALDDDLEIEFDADE